MANVDRPSGFHPVGTLHGGPWNSRVNKYYVSANDATVIGVGDLVKLDGQNDSAGIPSITQAAANEVCVGVVVGRIYTTPENLSQQHRPASTAAYMLVCDDPDVLMLSQGDGTDVAASVGLNVNFIVAAANTTTGTSGMEVDTESAATTNTLPLRIHSFVQSPDNEVGSANAKLIVSFNTHQFKLATGSTGI